MRELGALVLSLGIALAACGNDDTQGGGADAGGPSVKCTLLDKKQAPNGCTLTYGGCSDTKTYRIDCTGNGPYSCECFVNDAPGSLFDTPDLCLLNGSFARAAVDKGCGFKLN